jgi:putative phosphoribosyl transferase
MSTGAQHATIEAHDVHIRSGNVNLEGNLTIPAGAKGVVLFAHGSGSSRHSPRNQFVAGVIREAGLATLLFDLLTEEEESVDIYTRHHRFDIGMLSQRLVDAAFWVTGQFPSLRIGYFGASTGAGAALAAAAELGETVGAVVSRGGRPDLAGDALPRVTSPTLLIVGGLDYTVLDLNREAFAKLNCEKELVVVLEATHLFEEPGTLEEVARLAADWFQGHLQ